MMQINNGDDDDGGGGDMCVPQLKNSFETYCLVHTHTHTHNPLTSKKESQSGSVL